MALFSKGPAEARPCWAGNCLHRGEYTGLHRLSYSALRTIWKVAMRHRYDFNPPPIRTQMSGTATQREEWWHIRCWLNRPRLFALSNGTS